ncbi:glycosyltransferase family 9 protein [Crenobacter cavernae]|uniref:Lipopolysaccharide heptosyltransferase family protein n=1 Tax=Crenobacter cavernae TaxID=2290923 RepID=A0A345Y533_9NEIS|nr:glycosyltransferase family 9 protein [Crenobacter cavernae]AXK39035.1 lipopolysaccharide heptosyltransferase family protein [Crenobacter cavernae]
MKLFLLKIFDRSFALVLALLPAKKPPKQNVPRKVLAIKLSAMGDALCLMPALRMLHDSMPGAEIDWLTTRRANPGLFSKLDFLKDTLLLPVSPHGMLLFFFKHFRKLRSYDLVIDFDQYYRISELIAFCGRSSAGFHAPLKGRTFALALDYEAHKSEKLQFSDLVNLVIAFYGKQPATYSVELPELLAGFEPSSALQEFAQSLTGKGLPVVVLYPGSSMNASFRRWDLSNYHEVIKGLTGRCSFIVAGGPDEVELKPFFSQIGLGDLDHINAWTLKEWLWIFRHCADLLVGNDGGLLHLAESQGVPMVGIFGPALYAKWGSINPESIGIETEMGCRPCLRNYEGHVPSQCARGDRACLQMLKPEQVVRAIGTRIR